MCGLISAITWAVPFVKENKGQLVQADMRMTLRMAFQCDGMTLSYKLFDTTVELYGAMVFVLLI